MDNLEFYPPVGNRRKRKKIYKMEIDEKDMQSGVTAISLVSDPAIEADWVYLSKQKDVDLAQIAPDKRILVGPVLIPGKLIPRVDEETGEEYDITFTPETIERAAHLYMQRQNNNNATLEHSSDLNDISTVESWIITDPEKDKANTYGMSYPKGSWMVMMKVNNREIWGDYVKTGKIKGFSIEGMLGHTLVKASAIQTEIEAAEVTLQKIKELIEVELGWMQPGRGYGAVGRGVPPSRYIKEDGVLNSPPPNALPPLFGLSEYDGISLEAISKIIESEYLADGSNAEKVLAKIKQYLETSVSIGSSYAGQFGDSKKKDKVNLESYSDYPDGVKNNAKRALEWADKNGWGSCGTPVGKIRANQLAKGEPISVDTIQRMHSFLKRHEVDLESSTAYGDGCGKLMFDAWGGKAAMGWSHNKLKQLGLIELALEECPPATQDIAINLTNRQEAIDVANYGPLNPNEPNDEYWQDKARQFNDTVEDAKKALCGNCSFFNKTKEMLQCIAAGIGGSDNQEWDVIDAGELGYCEAFDFKCASSRTCDAWVVGGPIIN